MRTRVSIAMMYTVESWSNPEAIVFFWKHSLSCFRHSCPGNGCLHGQKKFTLVSPKHLCCGVGKLSLTGILALNTEEVGQAGRKASWVPVPDCARDSMAVVEWTSLTNMEAIEWQRCQASILTENSVLLLRSSLWFVFYHTKCTFLEIVWVVLSF